MGQFLKLVDLIVQTKKEMDIERCLKTHPAQRGEAIEIMCRITRDKIEKAGHHYDPAFVRQCILLEIGEPKPVSSSAPTVRA